MASREELEQRIAELECSIKQIKHQITVLERQVYGPFLGMSLFPDDTETVLSPEEVA